MQGGDVHARDRDGMTALVYAVLLDGKVEIVRTLLDAGADLNSTTNTGMTALMGAAYTGNTEMVQLFLALLADVNRKTHNGCPALMKAARRFEKEIVGLLAKAGATD